MRGTRFVEGLTREFERIIPAHAGNSTRRRRRDRPPADHPRACGELWKCLSLLGLLAGSSPRMRGTLIIVTHTEHVDRIIPAHAGNSAKWICLRVCRSDHPRACGELSIDVDTSKTFGGSSPRMRGTLFLRVHLHVPERIIPAHAGNSVDIDDIVWRGPDHPRACGELLWRTLLRGSRIGSSPRMRGTPWYRSCPVMRLRIIPAHAGNSTYQKLPASSKSDHPRACGELR